MNPKIKGNPSVSRYKVGSFNPCTYHCFDGSRVSNESLSWLLSNLRLNIKRNVKYAFFQTMINHLNEAEVTR